MTATRPRPQAIDTSILVTTFRRPRHLALVLESILLQRHVPRDFEIIVADDGSEDETEAVVASFANHADIPVRFTTQSHEGFRLAKVRNNAARLARGRYLMFVDGDCMIPPGHLAAHARRRRPGVALLGYCAKLDEQASRHLMPENLAVANLGALVSASEASALAKRHRRTLWHSLVRHPTKPRLAGGDFGAWRSDFEAVNGFDERFVGWGQEDDDLGLRLRTAGVRLQSILDLTQTLHVWHPTDPTATPRWRDGSNVAYFHRHGRLTACRSGLEQRGLDSILWGLPPDAGSTSLGRLLEVLLRGARQAAPGAACEIDLRIAGGTGTFARPAECRVLLTLDGQEPSRGEANKADRVVRINPLDAASVREVLLAIG